MTTLVLQPAAGIDTYISSANPTLNYGTASSIVVTASTAKVLIQFDLTSVPENAIINTAILEMVVNSVTDANSVSVGVTRSLVDWYEGNANGGTTSIDGSTWNHRNHIGSTTWVGGAGGGANFDYYGTPAASTPVTTTGTYSWDVTTLVNGILDGSVVNRGWWMYTTSGTSKVFTSSDTGTASNRPKLTIDYYLSIAGTATGTSTATGTMHADGNTRGSSDGIASVSGNLISNSIFGTATGISTVSGIIAAQIRLIGETSGAATVVGDITANGRLAGTASGASTVIGYASVEGQMRGTASGLATTLSTLHVYARHVARAQGCYADPLLYITDGTVKNSGQLNRLDLINPIVGYILNKWRPAIAQYKEGGTWSESARGTGRRLTSRVFGNAIEVFELKVRSYNQNDLFQYTHEYFAWQEDVADFWTGDWASVPVYLVAKGPKESNPRYAIIYAMSIPELENPYEQPLHGIKNSAIEQLTLRLERGDWMSNPPGQSECVAISSVRSWTVAGWSVGV